MKKKLSAALLTIGLMSGSNAYAWEATEVTQILNNVQLGLIQAKNAVIAAKTEAMEAWDKSAWGKQVSQMVDTIKGIQDTIAKVNEAKEKLTSEITGVREYVSKAQDWLDDKTAANPATQVNYAYAQLLPNELVTKATCEEDEDCVIDGAGYTSTSANIKSVDLRNSVKVNPDEVGNNFFGVGGGKTIKQLSKEAAELNAQEIAVIDTMAREAYLQASNRVVYIQHLKDGLLNPPEGDKNDLKYTTDLQAMISAEEALLINDQNRISALVVLQQSQRDRYEQRKKELANYAAYDSRKAGVDAVTGLPTTQQGLARVAITAATKGAYEALEGWYN